jgi:hypothetical protein
MRKRSLVRTALTKDCSSGHNVVLRDGWFTFEPGCGAAVLGVVHLFTV